MGGNVVFVLSMENRFENLSHIGLDIINLSKQQNMHLMLSYFNRPSKRSGVSANMDVTVPTLL